MFIRRFRPKWLQAVAAAILLLALALPESGTAQEVKAEEEVEVGDLMAAMEKSFIELVRTVLVIPVQESLDEPDFDEVGKRAGEIIETARQLPRIENYKDDNSFRNYALELENVGKRLADLARKKQTAASALTLVKLQTACLQCHKNFRF